MKIANKISFSFLSVSLSLITVGSIIFYSVARLSLNQAIYNNLESSATLHTATIALYLEMIKKSAVQVSKSVVLPAALKTAKDDPAYGKAVENAATLLISKKNADNSIYKYMLLDAYGTVVASTGKGDAGQDRSTDAYFLGAQENVYVKDIYYSSSEKLPLMAVSAPIVDNSTGSFLGVLVEKVTLDDLYRIVTDRTGLGSTGEVVVINKYGYLVSPSKYEKDTFLKKRIYTEMTKRVLQYRGQSSHRKPLGVYSDYRGVPVLGMYNYIPEMGWGVIAKIDRNEAFASLLRLRSIMFIIIFAVFLVAWYVGRIIAMSITAPIHRLHRGIEIIGSGNLNYKVGIDTKDEIGQLSRAFDTMTKNLKQGTSSIEDLNKEIVMRNDAEDKLLQALKAEVKSREIVVSMLADNNQVRGELENSLKELKEAQSQLVHAEKMEAIGRMASGVAHEVKNPLGIILQGVNYFEGELPAEDKDSREILQMMKNSIKRADGIVRALLDFSRAEELKAEQQDVNAIVKNSFELVRHRLRLNSIEDVCELGEDLPKLLLDRGKIEQVFVNLFNNAADAMPQGGKLYVRSFMSERKEAVIVEVEDTGAGIGEDVINKIFDPFFTTKNRTEGTGLGLSVVRSIIEMHKGLINVESKKGKGAKFTIVFKVPVEGGGQDGKEKSDDRG